MAYRVGRIVVWENVAKILDRRKIDWKIDWEMFVELAILLVKNKETQKAHFAFQKALDVAENISRDCYSRSEALSNIAQEMVKTGEIQKAFDIVENIGDLLFGRSRALEIIVREMANMGEIQKALDAAKNINNNDYKSEILSNITQFSAKNTLSIPDTLKIIRSRQKALVEHVANPFMGLKQSLNMFPFDFPLACHGVYILQLAYIKQKNWQQYHNIQQCLEEFDL